LVAVAIVAQAVLGMAQSLCPDRPRATIAVLGPDRGCAGGALIVWRAPPLLVVVATAAAAVALSLAG
jgi:chromate transporter